MIKKILITLLILIVLAIAGVISLVLFVDPNNFRGFISETVKDKTGYELTIEGDLRWHVWPQISILTDSIRLEDVGAKTPILIADNMRLDVELFPLFSKELAVKNVLVKAAVINITDESKGKVSSSTASTSTTTINKTKAESSSEQKTTNSGWSFSLNKLEIADSTVILQQDKDIISFRDINVAFVKKDDSHITVDLSGNINRDQQDFIYALNADINLEQFPNQATIELHDFSYSLKGLGIPTGELKGKVSAILNYQQSPLSLSSKNFTLTLNGNQINGKLNANLEKKPYFDAIFTSKKIDLTPFLSSNDDGKNSGNHSQSQSAPVVSTKATQNNELAFLRSFDAKFNLTVDEIIVDKLIINNFIIDANNKDGVAKLNQVNLDIAKGNFKADGTANGKQAKTSIKLATIVKDIDLGILLSQLKLANNFKGSLNASGQVMTSSIDPQVLMSALTAESLAVTISNARFDNIDIQHLIQTAVAQYTNDVATPENQQKYTSFHEISANANIAKGNMNLTSLKALSETIDINGDGRIGLVKNDLDINLQVKILGGWNGKSDLIAKLKKLTIPLRIYGTFSEIQYQLSVDKVIKSILNDKIHTGLDKLKDRIGTSTKDAADDEKSDSSSDSESNHSKPNNILGGLINKIKDDK